jgi:hypothetical protein
VRLTGSIMWEDVPWTLATIHAGDWLVKMVLITAILGAWHWTTHIVIGREAAFMSALVTEHFVLQTAVSATVSEAESRTSLSAFSLSSSLSLSPACIENVRLDSEETPTGTFSGRLTLSS